MAMLTCENVSFAYEGNTVVSNLSFSVNKGDYLCIIGENGSGKTTLIKGLLRLKNPQKGELLLGDGLKANEIGYLPQQTAAQKDFPASVYEVVLSGRLSIKGMRPFYSKNDKTAVDKNLKLVGMNEMTNRCYRELSGGQQRRALLARALCATQKMLLLDEPAAGLDPVSTQDFYDTIQSLNKQKGITVIMVSHDIQSAIKYAGHILHLKNDQPFYGTTDQYLKTNLGINFLGSSGGAGIV